ncbi:hypothetical protein [Arthrobacter sp. B0490]|uniref:hypothetical protein n=1 Tax=Arthrobacter sp. B0490 TaxID=2058891 RepID=UPI0015E2E203|nr:hypothetical protein [Arthrobacter sp. B0490]
MAATIHWMLTQGWGLVPAVKAQPATVKLSAMVAKGEPFARTRVLELMIDIWPPCGHCPPAPT